MGRLKTAFTKLAFMPNGEFSISRILMVLSAIQAFAVMWVGVVAYLVSGKSLPLEIYTYAGGIFGGGGLQYGFTKTITERRDARTTEDTPPGAVD